MGYTHYYNLKKVDRKKFKRVSLLFNDCVNSWLPETAIVGDYTGDGNEPPYITEQEIAFNGINDKSGHCESFNAYYNDTHFSFCKTDREPYDLAVCIILLIFKYVYGDDVEVNSDGFKGSNALPSIEEAEEFCENADENWSKAYILFKKNILDK